MATDQSLMNQSPIVFLGAGYTAQTFMSLYPQTKMIGTTRSAEKAEKIKKLGATPFIYDGQAASTELKAAVNNASTILISIAPSAEGDRVLSNLKTELLSAENLSWIGYLSTIGVYGNHDGAWVDETTPTSPISNRAKWRKEAEKSWLNLYEEYGRPVHIFRLPGIYGSKRGPHKKLIEGTARRIEKKNQVFNRAHVIDIAAVLKASMQLPNPGNIYNIADNEPAPPQDVLEFAANELGLQVPPLIKFEDAEMTEMARSFYGDNKRVSNRKIIEELGIELKYPTYREGIKACL